ncbi:MAG: response regulator transcription factor [Lachnospiraceae bacterium]|nr:response regulator transcription factor [Lachnospiraceae bacterium]
MMKKILMVEDDPQIRELVADYFQEKSGGELNIDVARTGTEGLARLEEENYDLVLLDVMLPGVNGFEICRSIRKKSIVPILFLTAMGSEEDALYGYSLGCDDYMVKPFSLAQLFAKVSALLNRAGGTVINTRLVAGAITLDMANMSVSVDGVSVELPNKEYEILKIMMENPGKMFSREELITKLWGYDSDVTDRVVDNHVKKLRKLLGGAGNMIKTTYKRGYSLQNI